MATYRGFVGDPARGSDRIDADADEPGATSSGAAPQGGKVALDGVDGVRQVCARGGS